MHRQPTESSRSSLGAASSAHWVALVCLALLPSVSAGQDYGTKDYDFQLDGFVSLLFEDDLDENQFGVRAAFPLSKRWQAEGRLTYLGPGDLDLWLLDASIKYFFDDDGRSRWYLAGGPGTLFENLDDLGDTAWLFHIGVGTEIDLSDRLYLRPELLARWNEYSDLDTVAGDISVGLGWRF